MNVPIETNQVQVKTIMEQYAIEMNISYENAIKYLNDNLIAGNYDIELLNRFPKEIKFYLICDYVLYLFSMKI